MSPVLRLGRGFFFCLSSLLLLSSRLAHGQERTNRADDRQAIIATSSQCNAYTINYITHSLPQSCPTKTWPNPALTSADPGVTVTGRSPGVSHSASSTAASDTSPPPAATSSTAFSDESNSDPAAAPFMSFEDWKEMMLRRAGQDPQELRQRKSSEPRTGHRAPPEFGDSGLGEEGEISLVFESYHHGGGGGAQPRADADSGGAGSDLETAPLLDDERPMHRSQDAGKTCKERFSYSSFDAGATILKTGKGTKNAKAILVENQDSYMLLECATQNKFIIVELSDDILIDTVVIANFEFFSSMIRHFRVSVSDRYPVKMEKWRDLGIFEARNSRDIQPFLVQNPQIWAKYVRLEFMTHYGNEYYCPVSLLRVHGSRMLDSWKDSETGQEEAVRDEDVAPSSSRQDDLAKAAASLPQVGRVGNNLSDFVVSSQLWSDRFAHDVFYQLNATCALSSAAYAGSSFRTAEAVPFEETVKTQRSQSSEAREGTSAPSSGTFPNADMAEAGDSNIAPQQKDPASASLDHRQASLGETPGAAGAGSGIPSTNTSGGATRASGSGATGGKKNAGTASASSASPTVQEGFFNAITKRLQQVETNLTLSLKYIEDQSRHLQDLLQRSEHKQITRLTVFLGDLNQTVLTELRKVQDQYDQIWQSTVLALESQRDQSERDIIALSTRLNVLADEVVFQKRMAILQAVLLLSCLFLVIFSRGSPMGQFPPSHEQRTLSRFSNPLSTSSENQHPVKASFDASHRGNICEANDRYLAVRASSEESQYTASLMDFRGVNQEDITSKFKSPPFAESGPQNSRVSPGKDLIATPLSHPSASNASTCTRKPLPSLPENSISTDDS